MSRLFDDASNQYLQTTGARVATPASFSCLFNVDDVTVSPTLIGFGSTAAARWEGIVISASRYVLAYSRQGATIEFASATVQPSLDTWQQGGAVFASPTDRRAFMDGANKGTNTGTCDVTALDMTSIGAIHLAGTMYAYVSGMIAEAGQWDVALTDEEMARLGNRASPLSVRPQNLVSYWPLVRDSDLDMFGAYNLTPYNSPGIAAHPRVTYPIRTQYNMAPSAVPMGVMAMYYKRMLCNS